MSSEWQELTLGDIMTLQRGMDLPVQNRENGPFPIVASTGIVGFHNEAKAKGPGVVIGRSGSIGGGQYIENDFWPLNTTLWIKDFKNNHPRFCYYLLRSIDFNGMNTGSGVPTLNRNHLHPMPVKRPPRNEQESISQFLGALDDRITLLRETNKTLESIAQAIFKSWFVDFDPVRAKMEGRQPEGMDEATAALFPDSFEESELGLIPRGWNVNPIGNVIQTVGGGTPATKNPTYWSPETYHWTSPKDLSGLQAPVLLDTERRISAEGLKKISSGLLPKGTLLMSSRAPIGYLALAQIPLAINQGYIAILPEGQLTTSFMLFWCKQNMDAIKGRANGSTFMEISKKVFRQIPIITPTSAVMDAFENTAYILLDRISQNESTIRTLTELRDTLLPRLISGQLRLPEAQNILEETIS